ncbi:uncharacterized protein LOC142814635 isoform X1 [Rhipicephalus microplus]|uniref:uncharacterized protein LOC142814635 isoform X1 n=1 Tax=Rhipicephalus microplus TaxID=6941 RepID=UPI003F6AF92F
MMNSLFAMVIVDRPWMGRSSGNEQRIGAQATIEDQALEVANPPPRRDLQRIEAAALWQLQVRVIRTSRKAKPVYPKYTPRIYANTPRRREPPRDTSSGAVRHHRVNKKKKHRLPSAARSSTESQATKETWYSTCLASWNAIGRKRRPHGFDASRLMLRDVRTR